MNPLSSAPQNDPPDRAGAPILLAHSYFLRHDPKQVEKMKPYPPLGTLLAASALRERGFEVRLFDAMLADGVDDFVRLLDEVRPAWVGIFEDNFNFLTKMCTVRTRDAAQEMIRAAKHRGALVAVNGSDATDRPELYLSAGADAVIVGEVEETAIELFEAWRDERTPALGGIAGLVLPAANGAPRLDAAGTRPVRTGPRPVIHDLDARPLPAWDLVDVRGYRAAWEPAHGRLSWNMVTSRGCPYGCNWCAKPVFGRRYTQRSPRDVARELQSLKQEVAPDHVWFADDIFGLTARWIEGFADEVARLDAAIPFLMQSRANLMTPRASAALRAAGCEEVWLGVESGSQRILDAMDKGTAVDEVRAATRNLRAHGIRTGWFLQLGYLGEEWADILLTRDLVREERPDDVGVSVSYPLPGTKFFETVQDELGARTNWVDSDELAMLFQGTYRTDFYRQVRELLHIEVRGPHADDATAPGELERRWLELGRVEGAHRAPRAMPSSVGRSRSEVG
jgi:anaerobic magnesium-protoporphyrin IX monomethyl ester cyclase